MHRKGDDINIGIAEYYWGKAPEKIHTVIGSCVSVAIWNPVLHTGGMCHYALSRGEKDNRYSDDPRYCEDSMRFLMGYVKKEKTAIDVYEVKLLGGASMLKADCGKIGDINIQCAEDQLVSYGFAIKARHVGGNFSRHIIFELGTGDVWVRTNKGLIVDEKDIVASVDDIDSDSSYFSKEQQSCLPTGSV